MKKEELAYKKGYRVSDDGIAYGVKGNKLIPIMHKKYYKISLRDENNKKTSIKIHRLQAFQKYGHKIYLDGIVVRHLNGNPLDNSKNNIAIGTQSQNMMDRPKEERQKHSELAASYKRVFDHNEVYNYYKEVKSYIKTMSKFNIASKSTLNNIIKRMKIKEIAIIFIFFLTSCNQEENIYDKRIREINEQKAKNQAKIDSIDLELIKLGVKPE